MINSYSFLLAGVGGQGTILASNVLADVGLAAGLDVKNRRCTAWPSAAAASTPRALERRTGLFALIGMGEADAVLVFERAEACATSST